MKAIVKPLIQYAIDKAKRNKFVQNLFESPFDLNKFPKMGEFQDTQGHVHILRDGLRSKIRPNWKRMLSSEKPLVNQEYLQELRSNGEIAVGKVAPIIQALGKSITNSTVLEIGCHAGATSYSIADAGAMQVVGTEFAGYKVEAVKTASEDVEGRLVEVTDDLRVMREKLGQMFDKTENVRFVDDDICRSALTPASFDLVFSWEVLEHLHDPEGAFLSISKLLKPGGVTVHEYNPFFCLNGGHSLCTLDMLWGHTQLSDDDFNGYLDQWRPREKEKAFSFFTKGMNRMTISDLQTQLRKSDLNVVSIIPFSKEQHLRMIDEAILTRTQALYPEATMLDLASPRVYVVAQRGQ
ncbi:MAG: class I SAM-dependent methyltransferase [Bacteroidota bacterium]